MMDYYQYAKQTFPSLQGALGQFLTAIEKHTRTTISALERQKQGFSRSSTDTEWVWGCIKQTTQSKTQENNKSHLNIKNNISLIMYS